MGDLLSLAAALIKNAVELKVGGDREGLEKACKLLHHESQSAIGTYRYGWAPLAPSTLAKKSADTPLLETGEMRDSIETKVGRGEAWVGSRDPKFAYHEWGTSHVPARPVFRNALEHKGQEAADIIGKDVSAKILKS